MFNSNGGGGVPKEKAPFTFENDHDPLLNHFQRQRHSRRNRGGGGGVKTPPLFFFFKKDKILAFEMAIETFLQV